MKAHDDDSGCAHNPARQLDDPRVVEALDEYLAALEAGQKPDRQEFLSRHAAIADALAECLEGMEALHQAGPAPQPPTDDRRDAGPTGGAAPADWQPGTPLGDYRIVREIGRGGMGVVYEAEQLSLGRRIALKVLPFALTLDPRQLQRFKNEARAAAQLHHQHIVPVYAVGSERGVHFYAMQFIEGQSLAEVIHDLRRQTAPAAPANRAGGTGIAPVEATGTYVPPLEAVSSEVLLAPQVSVSRGADATPLAASLATSYSADSAGFYRTVARFGIQAAEALEHAHEYGVIHRDIKPGNLMVDAHGHLWVTDFGLAQFQTDAGLTQSGYLIGTLRYMSPEQTSGQRVAIDHRTDIYSLGATLYELLTLRPPFESNSQQTLLHQILNDEPRPLRAYQKSIPIELETIVLKALAKAPAERYATAQELADDLSRFLQDQPIRARRATAAQRLRKWARRHPSIVWAAVILCLLTAAGSLVSAAMIHTAYERERQQADLARDAVDGMFKLCEEELADKPFLDGLRRRLLQDYFLVYYQKLIDQRTEDPTAHAELSAARDRVQQILDEITALQGASKYLLLNEPAVLDELHLTEEQRGQINALMDRQRRESFSRFWRMSAEQRREDLLQHARVMETEIEKYLTPGQRLRLRQIDLQRKGLRAFEESDVRSALQLTTKQEEQIRSLREIAFVRSIEKAFPCGPPPCDHEPDGPPKPHEAKRPPKPPEPPSVVFKRIKETVLTKEQNDRWRQLTGEPFTVPPPHRLHPPGRFGGRRP